MMKGHGLRGVVGDPLPAHIGAVLQTYMYGVKPNGDGLPSSTGMAFSSSPAIRCGHGLVTGHEIFVVKGSNAKKRHADCLRGSSTTGGD